MNELTILDLGWFNDEPRINDLVLADHLELNPPREIRRLIERNKTELERWGPLPLTWDRPTLREVNGTPHHRTVQRIRGPWYWLNEGQAVMVCMFARTPKAAAVRYAITAVFLAVRHGALGTRRPGKLTSAMRRAINREAYVHSLQAQREAFEEARTRLTEQALLKLNWRNTDE